MSNYEESINLIEYRVPSRGKHWPPRSASLDLNSRGRAQRGHFKVVGSEVIKINLPQFRYELIIIMKGEVGRRRRNN